ncbi:hypothetical protein [Sphingobium aquiterrae]|uniref:hypothetical protein n=1 Tax=Sphingobium aquiterrae TaxID=2038656 RepID=UPI00301AE491
MTHEVTAIRVLAGFALALALGTGAPSIAKKAKPDPLVPSGKTIDCVQTIRIRQTDVRDDKTIDFRMVDGKVYRNTLPYACSGLGFEKSFIYKTSISQLCSVDTITVFRAGMGGTPGPTCGLGTFAEMQKPAK